MAGVVERVERQRLEAMDPGARDARAWRENSRVSALTPGLRLLSGIRGMVEPFERLANPLDSHLEETP